MSSGRPKDGDMQLVAGPERKLAQGPDRKLMLPTAAGSTALAEYTPPVFKEEEEDLKIKLRRILENFPVRGSNTSGSSATSALATSIKPQYQQKRRKEQDRIRMMDVDYQRRKEEAEFNMTREERLRESEEKTAKKRLKRHKKKQRKKVAKRNRNKSLRTMRGILMIKLNKLVLSFNS